MKGIINLSAIFRTFGISITIVGIFMLTSIPFAIYYQEETVFALILSSLITLNFGQIFTVFNKKPKQDDIGEREAFVVVLFTWFMLGLFGALPYLISGAIPNFTNAYFETISGFTTTGASILIDIEELPKSILYWRSLTHWLGGMGILVLIIAILPNIGSGGVKLFVAEVPGPTSNKIHPKIRQTALKLWQVYVLLTSILVVLLMLGDMNFFESICHAFGTLSTGGFSPKNTSISGYSPYIQVVITIFMFFGGMNFVLHYYLIKGKIKKVISNEELIAFVLLIVVVSIIVALIIFGYGVYDNIIDALRHSFFQCVSIVSTTGFCSADYMLWPQATWFLLLLLFFTGGMIGSTSGSIKFTRHYILLKNVRVEMKRLIHPNAIIPIRIDKKIIPDDIIRNFFIIFVAYLIIFCLGTIIMSFFTDGIVESLGVTVSCLAGAGPAFGQFGPVGNYANLHYMGKWTLSIIMIIGRLEVIPIIMFFHYAFWKR